MQLHVVLGLLHIISPTYALHDREISADRTSSSLNNMKSKLFTIKALCLKDKLYIANLPSWGSPRNRDSNVDLHSIRFASSLIIYIMPSMSRFLSDL